MTVFAINGFGRIGKCILRALLARKDSGLECLVINIGYGELDIHAHLLKHDSTHGILPQVKALGEDVLEVGDTQIRIVREKDPDKVDWSQLGVELVLECSGAFTKRELAAKHINAGAKRVIVSAPCDGADATIVYGVNEQQLDASHQVISIGSCTTNCLAHVAKVLHDEFIIEHGFMTTVHAYTNDQSLLDASHKDKRRSRAAALSMIPSSTGAAKALGLVLPELAGKLDGVAIRVPVPNVSLVDLKVLTAKAASKDSINHAFKEAAHKMPAIINYVTEELVSTDFNHNPASCSFDATQTKVVGDKFLRVAAWYDNEWGFSNRMLDIAQLVGRL